MHLTTPNYITINASLQIKTAFRTTNWLELSHKFWNNDTHSNFSLTNQSNVIKKNIMHMVFKNEKNLTGLVSSNDQSMQAHVN